MTNSPLASAAPERAAFAVAAPEASARQRGRKHPLILALMAALTGASCTSRPPVLMDGVPASDIAKHTPGVMALLHNKQLKPEDPVQFKGYVVDWFTCPDCPEDIPCEPCEEWMSVGDQPDAPRPETLFVECNGRIEELVALGGFYLFRANFGWWEPDGDRAGIYDAKAWPVDD